MITWCDRSKPLEQPFFWYVIVGTSCFSTLVSPKSEGFASEFHFSNARWGSFGQNPYSRCAYSRSSPSPRGCVRFATYKKDRYRRIVQLPPPCGLHQLRKVSFDFGGLWNRFHVWHFMAGWCKTTVASKDLWPSFSAFEVWPWLAFPFPIAPQDLRSSPCRPLIKALRLGLSLLPLLMSSSGIVLTIFFGMINDNHLYFSDHGLDFWDRHLYQNPWGESGSQPG